MDPEEQTTPRFGLRLDQLWAVFAVLAVAAVMSLTPTDGSDFWWHLHVGRLISSQGIPTINGWSWLLPAETPYLYQSWLSQWLFFQLNQLGGLPLLIFVRNVIALLTLVFVCFETHRRLGSWRSTAFVVLFIGVMIINNLTMRPQVFSWLPTVVLALLLGRFSDGELDPRWLIAIPLVMAFWVNAHGAFLVGPLLCVAFAVGETIERVLRRPHALKQRDVNYLWLATVAAVAATLLNPRGPEIYGYLNTMFGNQTVRTMISEWQPPTPNTISGATFYLAIIIALACCAYGPRRPRLSEFFVIGGLAWMAFSSQRSVIWFALAAVPIIVGLLGPARKAFASTQRSAVSPMYRGAIRIGSPAINTGIAACALVAWVAVQPWLKPLLPFPSTYQALFVELPNAPLLFSQDTPVAAVEELRQNPCPGRLVNEMRYGSYLIWALPEQQVFMDTRIELYPDAFWQQYLRLSRGVNVPATLNKFEAQCVLLDRNNQAGLAEAMPTLGDWQLSLTAGSSELWRRTTAAGEVQP